jgi:transposase
MPASKKIELTEEQRKQLGSWARNPPRHHLRRKAWAILLSAEGQPAYQVAADRRVHAHRTSVSAWLKRFEEYGLEGLKQQPGQGRKPAFSP